ncbi:MAG: NAD-dependent epimerase/dehydratase family protein [Lachnospiraceae bacterium]|nr:NAD-dependent epimerase/dehydratase family protein [Lachnospiraceae bacterium]
MSKILITGAAGFIGSQLAYRLWKDGESVVLVDNFSYGSEDNLIFDEHDFREEIHHKDIRDLDFMDSLFEKEKFDYVYHIAGITPLPDCQNHPVDAVDVNVRGTVIILDLIRKYGVKKMVFASTSAVYENNKDFPSVETHVEKPSLFYPSTKYTAEQYCKAYWDAYHIPIVCLRFANVFGPHIDCLRTQPPVMGYIIREFMKGNAPVLHSDGEQKRDFIFVDDLIDLAILVLQSEEYDTVNVSTQTTVTINEITRIIAEKLGTTDIKPEYAETSHYWYRYPELYAKPYPISSQLMENEVLKYTCLSNEHAKEKYGWSPKTSLEEGIAKTVEFSAEVLKKAGIGV